MPQLHAAARFSLSLLVLPMLLTGCSAGGNGGTEEAIADRSAPALVAFDVAEPPAPAGRTTSNKREWSVAGVVKGRSETTISDPGEPAPLTPPPSITPPRPGQGGLLTAGDHDDLLNPEGYADYAGRFLQDHGRSLPFVDTRERVAVAVRGLDGRPVPFARVAVARAGQPLLLTAAADGVASYYPRFDRVPARTSVTVGGTKVAVAPGVKRVAVKVAGRARSVAALDLALVIDTTGSMGDEMAYLQAELDSILARVKREAGQIDLRIGLIVYRDEGDEYVVRSAPLTGDMRAVRATLARQSADGGGDQPEAVDQALRAVETMRWRPDAAKAVLLIADAPPHAEGIAPALASTGRLRARGVQIVPVAASGVEDSAQYMMRTMAVLTQGRYLFLTDDSGVGDRHAEPDLACYAVTRLDGLIARVLAGIVEGRRIEPGAHEVVRVVGDYRQGRCGMKQQVG